MESESELVRHVQVLEELGEEELSEGREGRSCSERLQELVPPSGNHRPEQSGLRLSVCRDGDDRVSDLN